MVEVGEQSQHIESTPSSEFNGGAFTITHLSPSPEGFTLETDHSLRRRDEGSPFPLTLEQTAMLQKEMRGESMFMLKGQMNDDEKSRFAAFEKMEKDDPEKKTDKTPEKLAIINEATTRVRQDAREKGETIDLAGKFGPKVGIRNIRQLGNILTFDTRPVSYKAYVVASSPKDSQEALDLGAATGTAAVLMTADNKFILQHRGKENGMYGNIPGASAAGMLDGTFQRYQTDHGEEKTGVLEPVTSETVRGNLLKEMKEEVSLSADDLSELRIVGVAHDNIRIHDEFLLLGKSKLTSSEIAEKAKNAPRSKRKTGESIDFEEKFFVFDATPETVETLLTEVKCPLPPTHSAAFIAAGYSLVLEQRGQEAAQAWKERMQEEVSKNYSEMNRIVKEYYEQHPEALNDVPDGKTKRNPEGYEPAYLPEQQGLPSIEEELQRTKLLSV